MSLSLERITHKQMAISTDVNAHGQMIMELRFSVAQAMIVCLVLIVFVIAATAVLVVALFYYKLDSQKAVDLAGQNLSMKGRSAIKHRGIRSAGQNAKPLLTRQGRVDEVWLLLLNIAQLHSNLSQSRSGGFVVGLTDIS